jgi:hypothetical protein
MNIDQHESDASWYRDVPIRKPQQRMRAIIGTHAPSGLAGAFALPENVRNSTHTPIFFVSSTGAVTPCHKSGMKPSPAGPPSGAVRRYRLCHPLSLDKHMNTPLELKQPTGNNKTLWAVVGILGVVLLAMGATVIRIQSRPFEPRTVVLPQPAQAPVAQATAPQATSATLTTATRTSTTVTTAEATAAVGPSNAAAPAAPTDQANNMPSALSDKAQDATENAASQAIQITAKPRPVLPRTPEPAVARPPAATASAKVSPAAQ